MCLWVNLKYVIEITNPVAPKKSQAFPHTWTLEAIKEYNRIDFPDARIGWSQT